MSTTGERVRLAREHYKISQGDFAESLSVKQSYLSYVEHDKRPPSQKLLQTMYSKYRINAEWILKGIGPVIDGEDVELEYSYKSLNDKAVLKIIILAIDEYSQKNKLTLSADEKAELIISYYQYFEDGDNISAKEINKHVDVTINFAVQLLRRP